MLFRSVSQSRYAPYKPGGPYGASVNAIPYFAYYDVFKNFYANKQEEYFMIMGGSQIITEGSITTYDGCLFEKDVYTVNYGYIRIGTAKVTVRMPKDLNLSVVK